MGAACVRGGGSLHQHGFGCGGGRCKRICPRGQGCRASMAACRRRALCCACMCASQEQLALMCLMMHGRAVTARPPPWPTLPPCSCPRPLFPLAPPGRPVQSISLPLSQPGGDREPVLPLPSAGPRPQGLHLGRRVPKHPGAKHKPNSVAPGEARGATGAGQWAWVHGMAGRHWGKRGERVCRRAAWGGRGGLPAVVACGPVR